MSHNTNPHTGHSGQYGIAPPPRDNARLDLNTERKHYEDVHDKFGTELDDLHNTGQHSGQAGAYIPDQQELGLIEVHVYADIDGAIQDANNIDDAEDYLHEVENGVASVSGSPDSLPLP